MSALLDPLNLLVAACVLAGVAVVVTGVGALLEAWRERHDRRWAAAEDLADDDAELEHLDGADRDDAEPVTVGAAEEPEVTGPWHRPRPFVDHEEAGEAPSDLVRAITAALEEPPAPTQEPAVAGAAPDGPSHVRLVPAAVATTPRRPLAEDDVPATTAAEPPDPTTRRADGVEIDAPTAAATADGASTPVIDLDEARARRTSRPDAVEEDLAPSTGRHPAAHSGRATIAAPASRRRRHGRHQEPDGALPRGAEAALQSILEIRPDPRNTLAIEADPTAEVRLTDADRTAATHRHGRPA